MSEARDRRMGRTGHPCHSESEGSFTEMGSLAEEMTIQPSCRQWRLTKLAKGDALWAQSLQQEHRGQVGSGD